MRRIVSAPVSVDLPPGLIVVVLGPATKELTTALWDVGLRPVRGQRYGTVWALTIGRRS